MDSWQEVKSNSKDIEQEGGKASHLVLEACLK